MKISGMNATMLVRMLNVTGAAISLAPDRRLTGLHTLLAILVDVLSDHDGVVDDDAEHHQRSRRARSC
jgi:hypothetical protein